MSLLKPLSVLAVITLVDAISYMVVAPSLIFYIFQVGGTKDIYGLISSLTSFASFLGKPVVGLWVDKLGNKFRMPYYATFALTIIGGLFYFFANAFQSSPRIALGLILWGRLLVGFGAAHNSLGYAYIACVIPLEQQIKASSVLSTLRMIGMAAGPFFNVFLSKVNYTLKIGNFTMPVDPLNSCGLLVAVGNLLTVLYIFFALPEPPTKEKKLVVVGHVGSTDKHDVWKELCCIEIILPLFIVIVVNSSFLLIDTALPPAAYDGLGWGPVQTSAVMGSTSLFIFMGMLATLYLSDRTSDIRIVALGQLCWIVGGGGVYWSWKRGTSVLHFVAPVMIAMMGFPFTGAPNRSMFTAAVVSKPSLESMQSLMQSILSMGQDIAGFLTPGLVARFILRTPEQVTANRDHRELNPWALYVMIIPIPILFGLFFMQQKRQKELKEEGDNMLADETTSLMKKNVERRRHSPVEIEQAFSRQSEVARRLSAEAYGFPAFETPSEMEYRMNLLHDLEEWQEKGEIALA